jgi:hypothetical protein
MDNNKLAAIEARLEEATPGPWKWREEENHIYSDTCGEVVCDMANTGVNLTLILNAPSDIRALLDDRAQLTAKLAEVEKRAARWEEAHQEERAGHAETWEKYVDVIMRAEKAEALGDILGGSLVAIRADHDRWKMRAKALINVVQESNKLCSSCVMDSSKTLCPSFKLVGHGCGNWQFDEARFTAAQSEATQ